MPLGRRADDWDARTGHVAPLEPGGKQYVAHVEGRRSVVEDHGEPFDGVEAAVAWAREHAPVVLVRLDGEDFRRSAGERPFEPQPRLPRWPP
jgi:hypothetical protein